MAVQLLEVFCCLMDIFAFGAGASAIPALGESKGPVSLANHQRDNKCQFADCRSLTFRSTDYCWKHQDGKPHEKTRYIGDSGKTSPEPVTISDPLLIPKIALGYVPFVWFLLFLTSLGSDAFAGYYFFIYSGMCLVFLLPIYAVYLVNLTWRRFKEGSLTLSVSIFHIMSFIVPFCWLLLLATFDGSPA